MDIEIFIKEYKSIAEEWFNYNNWAHLDFEEFWQKFIIKVNAKNDLSKYSESHDSKAQFKTWLKRVLKNFYIDESRKLESKSSKMHEKYESFSSDGTDQDNARVYNLHYDIEKAEEKQSGFDWGKIISFVDDIKNDKSRVVFKLKLFHQKYLPLSDDDYCYTEKRSGFSIQEIDDFLLNHQKQPFGIKNEDISLLLKMKMGSISTTYTRVRILMEKSYKELREV